MHERSSSVTRFSGSAVGNLSVKYWRTSPNTFLGVHMIRRTRKRIEPELEVTGPSLVSLFGAGAGVDGGGTGGMGGAG